MTTSCAGLAVITALSRYALGDAYGFIVPLELRGPELGDRTLGAVLEGDSSREPGQAGELALELRLLRLRPCERGLQRGELLAVRLFLALEPLVHRRERLAQAGELGGRRGQAAVECPACV